MNKKDSTEENLILVDENNKIKLVRSKFGKENIKTIIEKVPFNRRTLLICLAAGLVTGALLALIR
ncbi:MAG TPA: hypothetical protein VHQ70_11285 [Syntrophomonadaceae bacterium]|nr:hypothetical protein [Syntrophomonadaceae bacterium]